MSRSPMPFDHGRYIDLSDFDLESIVMYDNVEIFGQSLEALEVLHTPTESASTSRSPTPNGGGRGIAVTETVIDLSAPPPPPIPRLMKNMLKDRRRLNRQTAPATDHTSNTEHYRKVVEKHYKTQENFLLRDVLETEGAIADPADNAERIEFRCEVLLATTRRDDFDAVLESVIDK